MLKIEKTVFISYRRTNIGFALAIHQNLTARGYDVFFDYESIKAGDFEQIILRSIESRAHFVVILTPSALERCAEPGDWLRREIEHALEYKRNIVPLTFEGFDFEDMGRYLPPHIAQRLSRYNGLRVPTDYFPEAMQKLMERLNIPLQDILHPPPPAVKAEEARQQRVIVAQPVVTVRQLSTSEYFERGLQHYGDGRYNEAIADWTEAIRLKPDDAHAYVNRGLAYFQIGDYDRTLVDCDKSIQLNSDFALAYFVRGRAYYNKGEHNRALVDYDASIYLDPTYTRAYFYRGLAYLNKGDYDRAIVDYDRALAIDPNHQLAQQNREMALRKKRGWRGWFS